MITVLFFTGLTLIVVGNIIQGISSFRAHVKKLEEEKTK